MTNEISLAFYVKDEPSKHPPPPPRPLGIPAVEHPISDKPERPPKTVKLTKFGRPYQSAEERREKDRLRKQRERAELKLTNPEKLKAQTNKHCRKYKAKNREKLAMKQREYYAKKKENKNDTINGVSIA